MSWAGMAPIGHETYCKIDILLIMTCIGFKKNVNRATTQVMMKTGHVEKTNDRDYEVEERRFKTMEAASLRLQKEARGYLDSIRG